jgi:catechol 2,3-dioxygenase-like lactoylglutathione lyase family enzyme
MIRLHVTSVMVDDQEKALQFYTNVLGFVKKTDVVFRTPPTSMGPATLAAFEDTCGNVIQLVEIHSS